MMYAPGEKFQYNNTGYVILGLIIEKTVGCTFDKHLENSIFKPCNMVNTGYYELDRLPAKCANSYIYDGNRKEYYTNIYSVDVKGTGAGGTFTTILDIDNFWTELLNGNLISNEMLNKMLTLQSSYGDEHYGYGIWLEKSNDNKYFPFFQGCDPGVSFISFLDLNKNINITLVSNFGCNVWSIRRKIRDYFNQ